MIIYWLFFYFSQFQHQCGFHQLFCYVVFPWAIPYAVLVSSYAAPNELQHFNCYSMVILTKLQIDCIQCGCTIYVKGVHSGIDTHKEKSRACLLKGKATHVLSAAKPLLTGEMKLSSAKESAKRGCTAVWVQVLHEQHKLFAASTEPFFCPTCGQERNQAQIAELKNTVEALKLELSQLKKAFSNFQDQAKTISLKSYAAAAATDHRTGSTKRRPTITDVRKKSSSKRPPQLHTKCSRYCIL